MILRLVDEMEELVGFGFGVIAFAFMGSLCQVSSEWGNKFFFF